MHGKSKDSGRLFFMHGGQDKRNPPPRFETVKVVEEKGKGKKEKRETVNLVLHRGSKEIARGTGELEDLSLVGAQIVNATFNGNPGLVLSDHVTIVVTSKSKLQKFTARGDIKGWKVEGGRLAINLQFSPAVSVENARIFYAWREPPTSPNPRQPIGKRVFRDRRQRRR